MLIEVYDKKTKLEKMGKSVLSRTPNEHYLISNDEWRIVFGVNTILKLFQDARKSYPNQNTLILSIPLLLFRETL